MTKDNKPIGPVAVPGATRCDASLRLMPSIEIVFETQGVNAAAMAPHQLQGLYPDFDMPFDMVRAEIRDDMTARSSLSQRTYPS